MFSSAAPISTFSIGKFCGFSSLTIAVSISSMGLSADFNNSKNFDASSGCVHAFFLLY